MIALIVSRLAHGVDVGPAAKLFLASFMHAYVPVMPREPALPQSVPALRAFIEDAFASDIVDFQRLENPPRLYVAAQAQAQYEVVGYLSVDVNDGGKVYLRQLAVHPDAQRRGVAQALVKQALVDVEQPGVTKVTVSLRRFNKDAEKFYASLGFRDDADCDARLDRKLYKGMVWTPSETRAREQP